MRRTLTLSIAATLLTATACSSGPSAPTGGGVAASVDSSATAGPISLPSGATSGLQIRPVYASNSGIPGTVLADDGAVTASAPPLPKGTSPLPVSEREPAAEKLAYYRALDCARPATRTTLPDPDPNVFIAICGQPDAAATWFRYVLSPAVVSTRDVVSAKVQPDIVDDSRWDVVLTFTPSATSRWASYTASHVGTSVAILVGGMLLSAEIIQGAITGPTQIGGSFTNSQAQQLAADISISTRTDRSPASEATAPSP